MLENKLIAVAEPGFFPNMPCNPNPGIPQWLPLDKATSLGSLTSKPHIQQPSTTRARNDCCKT